jgi:hypothetical protein
MSKSSEKVKLWRKATKRRMIEAMGGKCQCCGYNKCDETLDFHHINPEEKEMHLGSIRASPRKWNMIARELRKCVLVCRNCHGELHYGVRKLPEVYVKFNEEYAEHKPVCSLDRARHTKVDWSKIDLREMAKTKTVSEIAAELDVVNFTVRKRLKKDNITAIPYSSKVKRLPSVVIPLISTIQTPKPSEINPDWRRCPHLQNRKVKRPTKEELEKMIWEKSLLAIGKEFGIRDNNVKKWCVSYGITDLPPIGYHQRRQAGYTHEQALKSQKKICRPKKIITREIAETAFALYRQGLSYRKAAAAVGFKHWGMQQAFERYGLKRIERKLAAQAGDAPACPTTF